MSYSPKVTGPVVQTSVRTDQNRNPIKSSRKIVYKGKTLRRAIRRGARAIMQLFHLKKKQRPVSAMPVRGPVSLNIGKYSPTAAQAAASPAATQWIKVDIHSAPPGAPAKAENPAPSKADARIPAAVAEQAQTPADSIASTPEATLPLPAPVLADIQQEPVAPYKPSELNSPEYNIIMDREFKTRNELRSGADGKFLKTVGMPAGFYSPQLQKMHQWFEDEFEKICAKNYETARKDGDSVWQALETMTASVNTLVCEKFDKSAEQPLKDYAKLMNELLNGGNKVAATRPDGGATTTSEHIAAPSADVSKTGKTASFDKKELQDAVFKNFQKQDIKAREALLIKHEDIFLQEMNEPAGRYSDTLESASEKFEALFKPAVEKEYKKARLNGRAADSALNLAGKLACENVCGQFLQSRDPAERAYARTMEKFERNVLARDSLLSGNAWTTISYEPAPDTLQESMAFFDSLTEQAPQEKPLPAIDEQAPKFDRSILSLLGASPKNTAKEI